MGNTVNTNPSSEREWPTLQFVTFGPERIKDARKLKKAEKSYTPKITELGNTVITKDTYERYSADTKKSFKHKVSSEGVIEKLKRLFERKYASKEGR